MQPGNQYGWNGDMRDTVREKCIWRNRDQIVEGLTGRFMANRWETVETVTDFILGGSKITEDGDLARKLKEAYFLERKL